MLLTFLMEETSFSLRVTELIRFLGKSKADVCKETEIDYRTLVNVENGVPPSFKTIIKLVKAYWQVCSLPWLLLGIGNINDRPQVLNKTSSERLKYLNGLSKSDLIDIIEKQQAHIKSFEKLIKKSS